MWTFPDKEGYMMKRGHGLKKKKWTQRYLRLKGYRLFYFKDETDTNVEGHIPLNGCKIISMGLDDVGETCFKLNCTYLDKRFYFKTDTTDLKDEWLKLIEKAIAAAPPKGYEEGWDEQQHLKHEDPFVEDKPTKKKNDTDLEEVTVSESS